MRGFLRLAIDKFYHIWYNIKKYLFWSIYYEKNFKFSFEFVDCFFCFGS